MELDLVCCAEHSLVDVRSNKITFINVYDGLAIAAFPAQIGPISTILLFRRSAGEPENIQGSVKFFIDDLQIFEGPYDADFQGSLDTRVVADLARMVIPKPGLFSARVFLGEHEVGSYKFIIDPLEADGDRLV